MSGHQGLAAGLLVGYVADVLIGDPARWHPVAGIGQAAGVVEPALYRDSRSAGAVFTAVCTAVACGVGVAIDRVPRLIRPCRRELAGCVVAAAATWSVLGGNSLVRVGERLASTLEAGDIDAARRLVSSLCGRDPDALDEAGMVRAAVESVAENTSDAAVAPLLWGAVAGVPGLVMYRTVNTLDAMVGYRNERYHRFGWAAARLDDAVNLLPARLTGVLVAVVSGRPSRVARIWQRDAHRHPSPNAGVVETSVAAALGITLGGRTEYPHGIEDRPMLGEGADPGIDDLRAAVRLSVRVQRTAVVGAAAAVWLVSRRSAR